MTPPLRHRRLWLAIGFALVGLVNVLSLMPQPVTVPELGRVKVGHVAAYLVLMLWFAQLYPGWRARGAIGAGLALMGVALEYAQGMTTYRTFGYEDMRDNALGVIFGLAMAGTVLGGALARVERWMAA